MLGPVETNMLGSAEALAGSLEAYMLGPVEAYMLGSVEALAWFFGSLCLVLWGPVEAYAWFFGSFP